MKRLETLDWLRGLMALSIVLYHSVTIGGLGWNADASTVLGRLGVYGVSIFFVLSGLSLAYRYHAEMTNGGDVLSFFISRAARIWPLLTVVVLLVAFLQWRHGDNYSIGQVVLAASGLFGFVNPTAYIGTGAWSIGNEMVFYALTPALIFAYSRSAVGGNMLVAATAIIGLVYAVYLLDPSRTLADQWATYVNPLNNLFLYTCGVAIFYNLDVTMGRATKWAAFLLPLAAFWAYPAEGDAITIASGFGRVVFATLAVAIVFGFYRAAPSLPTLFSRILTRIGVIGYGIYLLHPFAIAAATKLHLQQKPFLFLTFVLALTICLAELSFRFVESPLKNVINSLRSRKPAPQNSQSVP